MNKVIEEWIKNCDCCIKRKIVINIRVYLVNKEFIELLELYRLFNFGIIYCDFNIYLL